jgi:histone acetyltransferase MYST1
MPRDRRSHKRRRPQGDEDAAAAEAKGKAAENDGANAASPETNGAGGEGEEGEGAPHPSKAAKTGKGQSGGSAKSGKGGGSSKSAKMGKQGKSGKSGKRGKVGKKAPRGGGGGGDEEDEDDEGNDEKDDERGGRGKGRGGGGGGGDDGGEGGRAGGGDGEGEGEGDGEGEGGHGGGGQGGGSGALGPHKPRGSGSLVQPHAAQSGAKKQKKKQVKVVYNPSLPEYAYERQLPLGLELMCVHADGNLHMCRVLEAKPRKDNEKLLKGLVPPLDLTIFRSQPPHPFIYYVHYAEYNRRMDEWVLRERMLFQEDIPTLITNKDPRADEMKQKAAVAAAAEPLHEDHGDIDEESQAAHEEATKVKNVNTIVLGKYKMETWYFSPFPVEYKQFDTLYFCEFCLSFFGFRSELERHMRKCRLRHPPGEEIYRSDEQNVRISVFEVDGKKEVVYCQNLCYISKLFLDHKTLYWDTEPFLFYILTEVDEVGCHLVGYFSKEKYSEEGFNVACILTLPCHQRKGYGHFLISLSYELSKIEGQTGTPEKPLSDLGAVSYRSYWTQILIQFLKDRKGEVSINDIAKATSITNDDVTNTLRALGILRYEKGEHILYISPEVLAKEKKPKPYNPNVIRVADCDPKKLHWTPYAVNQRRARSTYG